MADPEYELFAIRYATRDASGTSISSAAIRMTGRCRWTISSGWRVGGGAPASSTPASPPRSPRSASATYLRCPVEALTLLGVDAGRRSRTSSSRTALRSRRQLPPVPAGAVPSAGARRCATPPAATCGTRSCRHSFEVEDVVGIVRLNFARPGACSMTATRNSRPGITLHAGRRPLGRPAVRAREHAARHGSCSRPT